MPLRHLQTYQYPVIGMPEGEEEEQEIKNLFEKIMKKKTSLIWRRKQTHKSRKHRVPNKLNPKRTTPRHIIKMPKVKDKQRILKAAREKQRVTFKGVLKTLSADFSEETAG